MVDVLSKSDSLLAPPLANDEHLRALATLSARLQSLDLTPLLVYDVAHIITDALPHLGQQFHVMGDEGWLFAETDEQKRALIRRAIELHRYKGTPWSVEESIRTFDYDVELTEWFEYGGDPYYFCVDINLYHEVWAQRVWDTVYGLIFRWKNARSHLERLRVFRTTKADVKIGSAVISGEIVSVYPYTPKAIEIAPDTPKLAGAVQMVETIKVMPFAPTEITLLSVTTINAACVIDDDIVLTP